MVTVKRMRYAHGSISQAQGGCEVCDTTKSLTEPEEGQIAAGRKPDLEWLDNDVPRAGLFGDTYFSKAGGLEETRHVFLSGNGLPDRFSSADRFTIAEFGFGTGLNFLTTLQALKASGARCHLTFLSFELYPMDRAQLSRALAAFPELGPLSAPLLNGWKPQEGWNILSFGQATLVLGIGDARDLIKEVQQDQAAVGARSDDRGSPVLPPVDAWFLDGFSPARNPQLWEESLLKGAHALTAPEGTLATYTSAGWVRRNLISAGFEIEKQKGFAGKREMVTGRKAGSSKTAL